jgi:hypothetical protein
MEPSLSRSGFASPCARSQKEADRPDSRRRVRARRRARLNTRRSLLLLGTLAVALASNACRSPARGGGRPHAAPTLCGWHPRPPVAACRTARRSPRSTSRTRRRRRGRSGVGCSPRSPCQPCTRCRATSGAGRSLSTTSPTCPRPPSSRDSIFHRRNPAAGPGGHFKAQAQGCTARDTAASLYPSGARPGHLALCLFSEGIAIQGAEPVRAPHTYRDPPAPPTGLRT